MTKEQEKELMHSILHDNKMLYCMHDRSCMETCMCWGLEVSKGWLQTINEMSMSLEALNHIFYPKFRVRVQMDQVKEKFGLLTSFYSIVSDPPKWMCIWRSTFQKVFDKIAKLDFKKVEVLDKDAYDEVVEKELASREEFEKEKKANARCANVEVFEQNGKFIRKATYHHFKKTHLEATKHKLLFKLLNNRWRIESWPERFFKFVPSHSQQCISKIVDEKAREIVKKAEDACYGVCEHCGHYISDESDYSPRCTTRGWISYLCQDCADKTGQQYIMNGAIWQNGKEVTSKQQYAEEKAKIEERFKKEQEEEDNED